MKPLEGEPDGIRHGFEHRGASKGAGVRDLLLPQETHRLEPVMDEEIPVIYLPPIWVYNRAIVREKGSTTEFVIRRCRLQASREASTLELIPVSECAEFQPDVWDRIAVQLPMDEFLTRYESTGRAMGVMRAPL